MNILDFYIPKHKYQPVKALSLFYPKDKPRLAKLSYKQFTAIYIKERKKGR